MPQLSFSYYDALALSFSCSNNPPFDSDNTETMSSQHSLPQLNQIDSKRICIIKPSALGDVVQTLPILPVLHERFPDATISWVIRDSFANLLEGHPNINEIIPFSRRSSARYWWQFLKDLKYYQSYPF